MIPTQMTAELLQELRYKQLNHKVFQKIANKTGIDPQFIALQLAAAMGRFEQRCVEAILEYTEKCRRDLFNQVINATRGDATHSDLQRQIQNKKIINFGKVMRVIIQAGIDEKIDPELATIIAGRLIHNDISEPVLAILNDIEKNSDLIEKVAEQFKKADQIYYTAGPGGWIDESLKAGDLIYEGLQSPFSLPMDTITLTMGQIPKSAPKKTERISQSSSEKLTEDPETNLKNWRNKPILLNMTEEQGKAYTGGGTVAGIGGTLGYSKLYHAIKLDKCHKCKGKSFSFADEEKTTIFCSKCGQQYQVIHPGTGKIWSFAQE